MKNIVLDWQALSESKPELALIPPQLRAQAERIELKTGETLFRINDRVQRIFSVVSGEIRLVRRDHNGTEIVLQRSRGGFIAEASLDNTTYHCDAVTAQASAILQFPVNAFRSTLDEFADFRSAWMTHLARELRKLRAQCERLSLNSAADRITHYIESEGVDGVIILNQPRKAWAAELGLTHEALYRALHRLQVNAVLQVDGNRISTISHKPESGGPT